MEIKSSAKPHALPRLTRTKPLSFRFTQEEIAELKRKAGHISLSEYVRRQLFSNSVVCELSDDIEPRLTPQMRQKLLAQILMRLGQLDTIHNLNSLINALQSGLIETSPELCSALATVNKELKALRHDLLKALGLRPSNPNK